jgi:membrane protein YqaA with SNARE-associated domain
MADVYVFLFVVFVLMEHVLPRDCQPSKRASSRWHDNCKRLAARNAWWRNTGVKAVVVGGFSVVLRVLMILAGRLQMIIAEYILGDLALD